MAHGQLNILGAVYGLKDVTSLVAGLVQNGSPQTLSVIASNSVFTDTWPDVQKTLSVFYNYDGDETQIQAVTEGQTLNISFGADQQLPGTEVRNTLAGSGPMLQIYGCTYGDRDVTSFVQAMIQPDQSLTFTVDPSVLGGDPLPNVRKNFVMLGSYTGYPALLIFQDGGQVSLTGGSITANQLFLASGYCFGLDKLGNLSNFNGIEASPVDTGFGSVSFLLGLQMFMIALENTVQDSPIFSMFCTSLLDD